MACYICKNPKAKTLLTATYACDCPTCGEYIIEKELLDDIKTMDPVPFNIDNKITNIKQSELIKKLKCIAAERKLNKNDSYRLCYDKEIELLKEMPDKTYTPIGILDFLKQYPSSGQETYNRAFLNLSKHAGSNPIANVVLDDEWERQIIFADTRQEFIAMINLLVKLDYIKIISKGKSWKARGTNDKTIVKIEPSGWTRIEELTTPLDKKSEKKGSSFKLELLKEIDSLPEKNELRDISKKKYLGIKELIDAGLAHGIDVKTNAGYGWADLSLTIAGEEELESSKKNENQEGDKNTEAKGSIRLEIYNKLNNEKIGNSVPFSQEALEELKIMKDEGLVDGHSHKNTWHFQGITEKGQIEYAKLKNDSPQEGGESEKARDYRKEYLDILRKCSTGTNIPFSGQQAKYAYELKQEGYLNTAEVLNEVGEPVEVMVLNITPKGRRYIPTLESEIQDSSSSSSSASSSSSSLSSSSSSSEDLRDDEENSNRASSEPDDGKEDLSDDEITSSMEKVSRKEFTDSTYFILTNAFQISYYLGDGRGKCEINHILAEGLWVGVTKKALKENPDYSFSIIAEFLQLKSNQELLALLHKENILLSTINIDYLNNANNGMTEADEVEIPFSDEVKGILKKAREIAEITAQNTADYKVHQRHLMTALLLSYQNLQVLQSLFADKERALFDLLIEHCEIWGNLPSDSISGWEKVKREMKKVFQKFLPEIQTGEKILLQKEGSLDEACIGTPEYVDALIRLFKGVSGDFCMGLFARWGRGKTFLIDLLEKKLEEYEELNYQVVRFSAWKFRTIPSLWCYLFEEFCRSIRDKGKIRYLTVALIFNFQKQKLTILLSLSSLVLAMVFTASLFFFYTKSLTLIITSLSLWGTLGIELFRRLLGMRQKVEELANKYTKIPSYKQQLGIQELLGNDLKNLICAATGLSKKNKQLFPEKYLLIIDDLDRCGSEDMLSIIENLMLLLDNDKIKEHLHIILVMEEEALRLALIEKYKKMIQLDMGMKSSGVIDYSKVKGHHIIEENIEKLLICYLRLNDLTEGETKKCVEVFTEKYSAKSQGAEKESKIHTVNLEDTINFSDSADVTLDPSPIQEKGNADNTEAKNADIDLSEFVYSYEEREKINEYIEEYGHRNGKKWGPRAIRAFLFKYQIARLLLGKGSDPVSILDAFSDFELENEYDDDRVHEVVKQVK